MTRTSLMFMGMLLCASAAFAEPPETVNPLRDLPPDIQAKMSRLTEIFSEAHRSGRLSDAQIQTTLSSGDAPAMIRNLGPEAAQLLQDISAGLREKYTEGELSMILGGLIGAK